MQSIGSGEELEDNTESHFQCLEVKKERDWDQSLEQLERAPPELLKLHAKR